jgi:hypothetical protein
MPDLCLGSAPKGANDFVYIGPSSIIQNGQTKTTLHVQLNRVPKSTGEIKVYVKSASGYPIPNANVNLNPDGSGWAVGNHCSLSNNDPQYYQTMVSSPGFSNANMNVSATGYALLDGLPSGNYVIYVWTPFSQNSGQNGPPSYNGGEDGTFSYDWQAAHCNTDDLRVTVDTNTTPSLHVYNAAGTDLNLSSITVTVETGNNTSGVVQGVLKFPSTVDLSANPIMLTLQPNCPMNNNGPCGQGNFAVMNGNGASEYAYSIPVASGAAYYMNVTASGWGRVNKGGGDSQINLNESTFTIINMNFIPAGSVVGTVYKPDGTVYKPGNMDWVYVNVNSNNGWTSAQVQKDGTFAMRDVLPGINRIQIQGGGMTGGFAYSLPSPAPQVNVIVGSSVTINLNLVNATYVTANLDLSKVPNPNVLMGGTRLFWVSRL